MSDVFGYVAGGKWRCGSSLWIDRAKPEIPEWSGRVPAYQGTMSLMTFFPIRRSFNLKHFNLKLAG
ncbi:MAG TPA: hypothetical protein VN229_00695, partial [Terriglobales bacterium]|nr:hypothetical protein [Terriglobales bacterium]